MSVKARHECVAGVGDLGLVGCFPGLGPIMTAPRVAGSLADLKVGQVVATICADGSAGECLTFTGNARKAYSDFMADGGTVVILSDPPPEPVPVPAEAIDRLREAVANAAKVAGIPAPDLTIVQDRDVLLFAIRDFLLTVDGADRKGTN